MTRSLLVIALGGNALSPARKDLGIAAERAAIDRSAAELAGLARAGHRLLIVHGNGPQVGRLLTAGGGDPESLDVHVAQTQGELGYLVAEALDRHLGRSETVSIVTRVLVDPADPAFEVPSKPIGAVFDEPPQGIACARTPDGCGWRRVVASPRPTAVIEADAIRALLAAHHVVAGGGGGVALVSRDGTRAPRPAVVDKDWVASLLAVRFGADRLVFVTDVSHAFDHFGRAHQELIRAMTVAEARHRLARGMFAPGSMEPKVMSAVEFVEATGRGAVITTLGEVEAALRGEAGTAILSPPPPGSTG